MSNATEKEFTELCTTFRVAWDTYIKFYTVFMTFNISALAVVVQFFDRPNRWPIVLAFLGQNVLGVEMALAMATYSVKAARRAKTLLCEMRNSEMPAATSDSESPLPGRLAGIASWANAIGVVLLFACWIAVWFFELPPVNPSDGTGLF